MIELSVFSLYLMEGIFPSPEAGFSHMREQGVTQVDMIDDLFSVYSLHQHMELFEKTGVKPFSIVSMLDFVTADSNKREYNLGVMKGYIDFMEKNGIPLLMPAPSVIPAQSAEDMKRMCADMIDGLDKLLSYAKGSGVTVAIENQSTTTRPDSKIADIKEILSALPDLKYILDSGNYYCVRENVLTAYRELKDRLVHVHYKDWRMSEYGAVVRENLPRLDGVVIGEGILPLAELAEKLKEDGYTGNVVLEINKLGYTVQELDLSAEFLRSCFK